MSFGSALKKAAAGVGLYEDGLSELDNVAVEYDAPQPPVAGPTYISAPAVVGPIEIPAPTPISAAPSYHQPAVAVANGDLRRITTIHPRSYNDARLIGEAFRAGTPVIMNLTDMSDEDAKRLVDFSSGLILGLLGGLEKVTNKVFLLSPEHVQVIGEEEVQTFDTGIGQFYNQS